MENFDTTESTDTIDDTDEPQQQAPQEPTEDDNADDSQLDYPDDPDSYITPPEVLESPNYDEAFDMNAKKQFHALHFNTRQANGIRAFWEKNAADFGGDVEALAKSFSPVAERLGIGLKAREALKTFIAKSLKADEKAIDAILKTSTKARGKSGSRTRAALIHVLTKKPAFADKNHPQHRETINYLNELYAGRNPF